MGFSCMVAIGLDSYWKAVCVHSRVRKLDHVNHLITINFNEEVEVLGEIPYTLPFTTFDLPNVMATCWMTGIWTYRRA